MPEVIRCVVFFLFFAKPWCSTALPLLLSLLPFFSSPEFLILIVPAVIPIASPFKVGGHIARAGDKLQKRLFFLCREGV